MSITGITIPQCKHCDYWNHADCQNKYGWQIDEEDGWLTVEQYGFCERVRNDFETYYGPLEGKEIAFTKDGENYCAELITRKDFHCSLFKYTYTYVHVNKETK